MSSLGTRLYVRIGRCAWLVESIRVGGFMKLDKLVNVSIVIVCTLMSAYLTREMYLSMHGGRTSVRLSPNSVGQLTSQAPNVGPREGDFIADTADLELAKTTRTLILVTASSCH